MGVSHHHHLAESSKQSITMVGMSWDNNDERKMISTFGFGRGVFGSFVDAAAVALELGFAKRGLASLADSVLGITLLKSQHVRLPPVCDWVACLFSAACV